jgi:lipopolysaccharide transport system permease protein
MPDTPAVPRTVRATYRVDAADPQPLARALDDLSQGLARWRLAWALAWLDIRNRYRGSILGPFWLTLSTGIMLGALGLLYSTLFRIPVTDYLPHLAASLVVWNAISGLANEATTALSGSEGIIRQIRLPYTVHVLRCLFRNGVIFAHNLPLIALIFALCGTWPGAEALLALPGFLLIAVDAFAAVLFLGMLCARFRDIGPIVGSVMQLSFFLTPVMWKPELLGEWQFLLPLNPFYAVLETVRGPLVEGGGPLMAWVAALVYSAALWAVALAFFIRFRARVAFWV